MLCQRDQQVGNGGVVGNETLLKVWIAKEIMQLKN
jgi:hypothetical protein